MTDIDKIVDKVRKLHAHAESAKKIGNEAEAQAFAAKVQELLAQYKLSMSEVEYARRDDDDPIEVQYVEYDSYGMKTKAARQHWTEALAAVVGRAYYCRIVVSTGSNAIAFVGRAEDRAVSEFMFVTLARLLDRLSFLEYGKFNRECVRQDGDAVRSHGFRDGFKQGFIHRLSQRFEEEVRKMRVETPAASTAIIRLQNAMTEVDAFMEENYGKKENRARATSFNRTNDEGAKRGRRAADDLNLNGKAVNEARDARPNALLRD